MMKNYIVRFGIFNLRIFRNEMDFGNVKFIGLKENREIINEIRKKKKPLVSAIAEVYLRFKEVKNYKLLVDKAGEILDDYLLLLSLAQGRDITWSECEVYKNNLKVFGFGRSIRITKINMGMEIIWEPYVKEFVDKTIRIISNKNFKKTTGFDHALTWYLESLGCDLFESSFLNACISIEIFVDRFHENDEAIFTEEQFKELEREIKRIIKVLTPDKKNKKLRELAYHKIKEINRKPIKSEIKRFFNNYKILYKDVDEHFNFISLRNEIVHTGIRSKTESGQKSISISKELFNIWNLLHRIFLTLLKHEGEYRDIRYAGKHTKFPPK